MANPIRLIIILAVGGFLIFAGTLFYTVGEDQQAIVLRFGKPIGGAINLPTREAGDPGPGLHFKVPIDNVVYFDRRNMEFDLSQAEEIIVANEERLLVDAFVRYRITDPLAYFQALGGAADFSILRANFDNRLTDILNEAMRGQLGSRTIRQIINTDRVSLMAAIREDVTNDARDLGVSIIDVRIRQADFPDANATQVHNRMISNYNQQAELILANGDAEARKIRASADEQVTRITAAAEETSQVFRGRADAIKNCIFAEAFAGIPAKIETSSGVSPIDTSGMTEQELLLLNLDEKLVIFQSKLPLTCETNRSRISQPDERRSEFFKFYRSLDAYGNGLTPEGTTFVISPNHPFFRYFNDINGEG